MRTTSLLRASALLLLALVALPTLAHADASANNPQVARLLSAKTTLKWNQALGATQDRYGHAEALVNAPADQVAKAVLDFGRYKELHRKFANVRVIGREGDATDVYMRYPVQIGALKIELHEVMRFSPDRPQAGVHVIEGRGVKGDMKRGHTVILVNPVDATHSLLQVDILLVPTMPTPQSFIDEELRDGAGDYVSSLKDRVQGWAGPVVSL